MKSLLLCIGLSLLFTISANAQDSVKAPKSDTAKPTAEAPILDSITDSLTGGPLSDSIKMRNAILTPADSAMIINKKSPSSDSSQSKAPASPNIAIPANDFKNSDTSKIVDIFEEMKKAQIRQDNSIKKEQETQKESKKKPAAVPHIDTVVDESLIQVAPSLDSNIDNSRSKSQRQTPLIKKDTIQSIFTLPAPDTSPAATGSQNQIINSADAAKQVTGQPVFSNTGIPTIKNSPQHPGNKNKDSVQTPLDELFAATAEPPNQSPIGDSSEKVHILENTIDSDSSIQYKNNIPSEKSIEDSIGSISSTTRTPTPVIASKQNTDTIKAAAKTTIVGTVNIPNDEPGTVNPTSEISTTEIKKAEPHDSSNKQKKIDSLPFPDSIPLPQSTPFTELFQPYRTFDKETKIESTTSLTILQQNVDYKTSADFTTQYQRTGQSAGQFIFDVSVVRLNTQVETMGVQLKYDSNKQTDSTSTFAKPLFDIVGKRTYLQVDSTGRITRIDTTELGRQVNTVLSGLSLSGGDFEIGSNFGLLLSKSGEVKIGQKWSDSVSHQGNKRITTYTVKSIIDGDLFVQISGTVSQTGDITSDGAVFKTHFTGTQNGKMYVDQKTLLVKSREITLNMKGTVDYNGQSLPAAAVSKVKEQVTAN